MRRKPVVVVGVAAMLLGVGVVAAGQAWAQETPQWPHVSRFSLSGLPGFSVFGSDDQKQDQNSGTADDSDATDDSPRGLAAGDGSALNGDGADVQNAQHAAATAAGPQPGAARDGRDHAAVPAGPDHAVAPAGPDRAAAPAGPDHAVGRAGHLGAVAQRAAAGQRAAAAQGAAEAPAAHAVPEMPKVQKPAVIAQRPAPPAAGQKPALSQQDAGGSLVAQAKENVTARDISTSPGSPVQQQILALINQDRRQHGCGGVTLDPRLIGAANSHAADMARHNYFEHNSRDGSGAGDRVTRAGYRWRHYGENIARGVSSPYAVVNGWMNSPEHRHNILDCSLAQMGIGLAIAGDRYRTVYWVQDFATPM